MKPLSPEEAALLLNVKDIEQTGCRDSGLLRALRKELSHKRKVARRRQGRLRCQEVKQRHNHGEDSTQSNKEHSMRGIPEDIDRVVHAGPGQPF